MNVLDWDMLFDVFNDGTTQRKVNWHRHMTQVDPAVNYYNTGVERWNHLANKVTRTERNRSVVSAI